MTSNPLHNITAEPDCCEEASTVSIAFYIPCNEPASRLMYDPQENRTYRMCPRCARHNLFRGLIDKGPYVKPKGGEA